MRLIRARGGVAALPNLLAGADCTAHSITNNLPHPSWLMTTTQRVRRSQTTQQPTARLGVRAGTLQPETQASFSLRQENKLSVEASVKVLTELFSAGIESVIFLR